MSDVIAELKQELDSPILRAATLPTVEEVNSASEAIGVPFPADYRRFLLELGGAMVGPYPIYGLRPVDVMGENSWSVIAETIRYRSEGWPGCENWVVISSDHAGNPVGLDADGKVWINDHDFGGVDRLANDFADYITRICLGK